MFRGLSLKAPGEKAINVNYEMPPWRLRKHLVSTTGTWQKLHEGQIEGDREVLGRSIRSCPATTSVTL